MIEVLFSEEFDSGVWTGYKSNDWRVVGKVTLGELGLLDLIEIHLGLKIPETNSYQRKIDCLQALKLTDNNKRFYSKYLANDTVAVVEHLLQLRDNLLESGWDKTAITNFDKITDLSEVEINYINHTGASCGLPPISLPEANLGELIPVLGEIPRSLERDLKYRCLLMEKIAYQSELIGIMFGV